MSHLSHLLLWKLTNVLNSNTKGLFLSFTWMGFTAHTALYLVSFLNIILLRLIHIVPNSSLLLYYILWPYHKLMSFHFSPLQIRLLWAFLHMSLGAQMYIFLLDICLGMEMLGYRLLHIFPLDRHQKQFSNLNIPIYTQLAYVFIVSLLHVSLSDGRSIVSMWQWI